MGSFPLSRRLLAHQSDKDEASGDLEALLTGVVAEAKSAHPSLAVEEEVFVEFLAERLAEGQDLEAQLTGLHAADLYLACACAHDIDQAAKRLETLHIPVVGRAIGRIDSSSTFGADVAQQVREKLLLGGPDGRPKINDYAGRGSLSAWIRVIAVRTALNIKASQRAHQPLESDVVNRALVESGFEAKFVRSKYAGAFKEAMATAIASLPARDRAALRLRFIDGLNIDQIGTLYDVHRATVARWIASAREQIRVGTLKELGDKLDLTDSDVKSLVDVLSINDVVTTGLLDSEPV